MEGESNVEVLTYTRDLDHEVHEAGPTEYR